MRLEAVTGRVEVLDHDDHLLDHDDHLLDHDFLDHDDHLSAIGCCPFDRDGKLHAFGRESELQRDH
ncbi:MAG: hypothetical protein M0Z88_03520 [Actinomycetota bacterium]|nr:hypothetical protein [Actinomycetota bacterium]